jgi:cholesterol oxidase
LGFFLAGVSSWTDSVRVSLVRLPPLSVATMRRVALKAFFGLPIRRVRLQRQVRRGGRAQVAFELVGYANTLYRPRGRFFRDPQWAHLTDDWEAALRPHFVEAERMLGVTEYTRRGTGDDLLKELADELGVPETYGPTRVGVFLLTPTRPPDLHRRGGLRRAASRREARRDRAHRHHRGAL